MKKITPLKCGSFKKYLTRNEFNPFLKGHFYRFQFENGYGASVIKHMGSHGYEKDLFELGVLFDDKLCYTTEICDDVIGFLTNDEVLELLEKIKKL